MRFSCEDTDWLGNGVPGTGCGEISHVLFDGYSFGDRLLEGVMFKAFIKENAIAVDSVDEWETDPYLIGLNKEHWMEEALDFAKKNDIAECPNCGLEVGAQPRD